MFQAPLGARNSPKFSLRVTADARAAMRQFVRPHQHLEIFFGIYLRTGFQQNNVEAALGENFGGHAAACAGADDADVIGFLENE